MDVVMGTVLLQYYFTILIFFQAKGLKSKVDKPGKSHEVLSDVQSETGHYPHRYCHISETVLHMTTGQPSFRYISKDGEQKHHVCGPVSQIWPLQPWPLGQSDLECLEVYSEGFVFTIYYWGGSNYFHLHYDMMIPLFQVLHYGKTRPIGNVVLMPSVETTRLQAVHWDTPAFQESSTYWMQLLKVLAGSFTLQPLDRKLLDTGGNICIKQAHFGTPAVNFGNKDVIKSYVEFIKNQLQVSHILPAADRIGLITRAKTSKRRILNEDELVQSVSAILPVDLVEFAGQSFLQQVQLVQQYSILIGVNGAGLTNALYLPPGGVAVQLVPYNASVNYREFGMLLKCRGPYLEWHNKHEDLTQPRPGDAFNSGADTIVHIEEFVALVKEAVDLVRTFRLQKKSEL